MEKIPSVTIMIPTYNQEDHIGEAIQSALMQDYKNIEIIISDDNSTDSTGFICKSYLKNNANLIYHRNSINLGRISNYRKLLYEYAKGDFVINLDGDDKFIDNSFISRSIYNILGSPSKNIMMLVACKKLVDDKEEVLIRHSMKIRNDILNGKYFVFNIFSKYQFSHLTTLYKRNEACSLNFYSKDIQSTDMESLLRLALIGDVIVSNDVVGQWNRTGSNISTIYDLKKSIENLKWIKSVENELKKSFSPIQMVYWRLKCHIKFSYPILLSIRNKPNSLWESKSNLFSVIKLFIPISLFSISYLYKKLIGSINNNVK